MPSTLLLVLLLAVAAVHPPPTAVAHPEAAPTKDELYAFAYSVDAPEYENFQDRQEARLGEETRGRFRVALPDNRLQTVLYRADGKGFSARISYDQHPDFSSLRETIGPIGKAPEIGQSVLDSIRRGENWKNHKDFKDGRHPEHPSRHGNHGALDNTVLPTLQPTTNRRQRPSRLSRPTTTRSGPSSSPKPTRRIPTTRRTSSTRRPSPTPLPAPVAQRLTATPSPSRRPSTTSGTSAPSISGSPSLHISPEDYEDPEILSRLIEAIRLKVAEEGLKPEDEESHEKEPHRRYSIGDKASVLSRLRAVVHAVHLVHHQVK